MNSIVVEVELVMDLEGLYQHLSLTVDSTKLDVAIARSSKCTIFKLLTKRHYNKMAFKQNMKSYGDRKADSCY